jgi:pyruvate kinase
MFIVATISKNSYAAEKIEEILRAGAEVLRFNFSHGTPDEMQAKIKVARDVITKLGLQGKVKILADLPGSKIRLGDFTGTEYEVKAGQEVVFKSGERSDDPSSFIPVDFPSIGANATVGQTVTLGDGEVAFEVTEVIDDDSFRAKALNSRFIPALKGINLGKEIDKLDHITDKTIAHVRNLARFKPEWVAFSFVNSKEFLVRAKKLLAEVTTPEWQPKIVSKVETPLGIENIDEIAENCDILLVARGDLGLVAPIEMLGVYQKKIVASAKKAGKQVIVSTQILDSLLSYFVPSRAEVLDLTNIVMDGADGIMLAKETGISQTPGYSVETARKIINAVMETNNK